VNWRRLQPGELDHEALWLGVSLAGAGVAWAWLTLGLPRPGCPWHLLTGCPCPSCGTTRCIAFALGGQFGPALRMNPLCAVVLAGGAMFDLYAAIVLAARLPRLRFESSALSRPLRFAVVSALMVNWLWLIRAGV
jgi:hypothetical protein